MSTITNLRPEILTNFEHWTTPTGIEIKTVVEMIQEKTGKKITGSIVAKLVGIESSRTYRRWISGHTQIHYAQWCILCYEAGLGKIWEISDI